MLLGDNIQTFTSHGGPMVRPEFGPFLFLVFNMYKLNTFSLLPIELNQCL